MSIIADVLTACPTIQDTLNAQWGSPNCVGADEKYPHLQFLLSDANRRPISMNMTPGGGKTRQIQLTYYQRLLESTVASDQSNPNCGVGVFQEDANITYSIDTTINKQSQGFRITPTYAENVCRGNGEIFAYQMFRDMDSLVRRVATLAANQSATLYGTWGNGLFTTGTDPGEVTANELHVKTLTTVASNTINLLDSHPVIWNAWEDIGGCGAPFIVGGTTLQHYYQATRHGCCADQGIDLSGIVSEFGYSYARDRRVAVALGSEDKALIMSPGAQQLIQYLRSPWKDGMPAEVNAGADYIHTSVMHPGTGLLFDWTVNDDCGVVTSNLTWTGKVIGMPDDMFASGDVYAGWKGVAKIKVLNA